MKYIYANDDYVGKKHGLDKPSVGTWVYQLQSYKNDKLTELSKTNAEIVVIDLARDAKTDFFKREEINHLQSSGKGKKVLAYMEIGSIETFRPEYAAIRQKKEDLIVNQWEEWPDEYFVQYWDERWWNDILRKRVDQALSAEFDGVYLDTPLAYEQIDLSKIRGLGRDELGRKMVDLIMLISRYAKQRDSNFMIFPQNSPELRRYDGYVDAIDGIGMEEMFFLAMDKPCNRDFCKENLDNARALRDAGKMVLAVDYATTASHRKSVCDQYRAERFIGYVTQRDLNRVTNPCD